MNPRFSLYLDFVRAFAALVVVLSHWAYPRFTDGSYAVLRSLNLGSDAVIVFFVLSGLVIAYTAEKKDSAAGAFLFNRATRVLSVALPALLACFALDRAGAAINPGAYDGWWYNPVSLWQTLFYGLSFSGEWGGAAMRLGTNGPYWSLSYEVAYYLLFAAAVFLRGPLRLAGIAVVAALAGLNPLLLLPAWLAGVAAWRFLRSGVAPVPGAAVAMTLLPCLAYVLCLALEVPQALAGVSTEEVRLRLRFSDEFLWNGLLGLMVAVHFLGAAHFPPGLLPALRPGAARAVKWLAGASFSLYLVHYPAMQFFHAVLPGGSSALRDAALLLSVLAFCLVFAGVFERRLAGIRRACLHVFGKLR